MTSAAGTTPGATDEAVFAKVLDLWKHGIDVHDTAEIGSAFAEDTIFQGGRPEPSRGRAAVVADYNPVSWVPAAR